MKRSFERILWLSGTCLLAVALVVVLNTKPVFAKGGRSESDYLYDIQSVFHIISQRYVDEVDQEELSKGAIRGMFETLDDPYSTYLEKELLTSMMDTTNGNFGGVGLYISREVFDEEGNGRLDYVKVVSPIEGTPAYRAGVHAGDYIYEIEGESAKGFSTDDVSSLLRGEAGTSVNVTFLQPNGVIYNIDIERAIIEIPTVRYDVIDGHIGFLRIIEFTPFTADRVREAVESFKDDGCDKLIIDVRGNPGGLLDSVVEISDFFFHSGTIVSTNGRIESDSEVFNATRGVTVPQDWDVYILIDEGSASASEILTGALKDRERAIVVGRTSYGKGSVQQVMRLGESALKLTVARYYTPSGVSIDQEGIEPDYYVEIKEYSDEEIESYQSMVEQNLIGLFLDEYSSPSEIEITQFISRIQREGIILDEYDLRRIIRAEEKRRMDFPPVVDLNFDKDLQRVMELINE